MPTPTHGPYDAILLVSFGGPEKREDVMPFLENVLRGKNVPRERMLAVAEHYDHFGGKSPINDHNRALIAALEAELAEKGPHLPLYWGNRNWRPMLADTMQRMADDGARRALAFVTSAYSSYSSCRQYLEDIARAQDQVGSRAPAVDKLRLFYNHPGFIEPMIENVETALAGFPQPSRSEVEVIFTAHSIPMSMAGTCRYVEQLEEASRLVSEGLGRGDGKLVYQSRSGPPSQPWLEPDVLDYLKELHGRGVRDLVVAPIGFLSDHIEVLYDLDTEARALADELGLKMIRASTVGLHPKFVRMIRELIVERVEEQQTRRVLGRYGPEPDACPAECCPRPQRPAMSHPRPAASL